MARKRVGTSFAGTVCGPHKKGRGKDGRPFLSFPVKSGEHIVTVTVRGSQAQALGDSVHLGAEFHLEGRLRSVLYLAAKKVEPVKWQRFRGRLVKESQDDGGSQPVGRVGLSPCAVDRGTMVAGPS